VNSQRRHLLKPVYEELAPGLWKGSNDLGVVVLGQTEGGTRTALIEQTFARVQELKFEDVDARLTSEEIDGPGVLECFDDPASIRLGDPATIESVLERHGKGRY